MKYVRLIGVKRTNAGVSAPGGHLLYELTRNVLLSLVLLTAILIGVLGAAVYWAFNSLIKGLTLILGKGARGVRTSIKTGLHGQ